MLSKGELKKKLVFLVMNDDPELTIPNPIWDRVYNYYLGYSTCFKDVVKFPVDDSFAQNYIIEECYKHLTKILR